MAIARSIVLKKAKQRTLPEDGREIYCTLVRANIELPSDMFINSLLLKQNIVSDKSTGRMLLSHNFNLSNNELPALNREEFARVFIDGLKDKNGISCSYIQNPHWVVEIIFPAEQYEAKAIGQMCGEILTSKRKSQTEAIANDTLILAGKKTTPASSTSATSLQPGEWGVDVVETAKADIFLKSINWDALTADKPSDGIFRIDFLA